MSISKEENTIQIQLNTNIAEPVITYSEGGEEWLVFDKRSDFGGKVTLSFKAAKNVTYKERSATITISSPLVTNPVNVNVNQKRTEAIIPETDVLMYDLSARTISFKVRYNVEYTLSPAEQQQVLNILKHCGVLQPPKFDAYIEDYDW